MQLLLQISFNNENFKAKIGKLEQLLVPIMTEFGICYVFNSKLASILSPLQTLNDSAKEFLYTVNYFDLETEVVIEELPSNFDVRPVIRIIVKIFHKFYCCNCTILGLSP